MSEHLSFDEIVNFIYSTDVSEDMNVMAHRVNSHIINCESCRHIYDTVYELYELGFEKGILEVENNLRKIDSHDILFDTTFIKLKIQNGKKLLLEHIKNLGQIKYYFSHPVALATRDTGEGYEQEDALIDDENEYNEISIKDGKLIIQLDREDYNYRAPELMVKDGAGNMLYFDNMNQVGEYFVAEVDIPEDSDIEIKFG